MPDWSPADLSETSMVRELRAELTEVRGTLRAEQETNLLLIEESYSQLELAAEDAGWQKLAASGAIEFSDAGLRRIAALCQLMLAKNPLVVRACAIRAAYTWGEGVSITARSAGDDGQDVNAVVQSFLDDDGNEDAWTGPAARVTRSNALDTDGGVFVALFTRARTGKVAARPVPFLDITDVITNPDDRSEPWYYQRDYVIDGLDPATGRGGVRHVTVFYPALGYDPRIRPSTVEWNGVRAQVRWDAPMLHVVAPGRQMGWKFACPPVYPAIDWARAYSGFLSDWATLCKALSRYAFTQTGPGRKQAAARAAIAAAPARGADGLPLAVGATAQLGPDQTLTPVPKTGATLDSDSGRPLAAMVSAALGPPVTMLLGDPGVTGARATATTLDRQFELGMQMLRQIWEAAERRILNHVIDSAIKAPLGALKGVRKVDDEGAVSWELTDETDRTVDVEWPEMDDVSVKEKVDALVATAATNLLPKPWLAKAFLLALGATGVDELVAEMLDEDGNFIDPVIDAGIAAVQAFRRGQDPGARLGDDPAPEPEPEPVEDDDEA